VKDLSIGSASTAGIECAAALAHPTARSDWQEHRHRRADSTRDRWSSFCSAPIASSARGTRVTQTLWSWRARGMVGGGAQDEEDAPNLGRRTPIGRMRGAQGVDGI